MTGDQSSSSDRFARLHADRDLPADELLEICAEELELKSAVLDGLADGILVHTLEGEILYFNPAAAIVYGFEPEAFARLGKWGWVPPESAGTLDARLAALRATGVHDFQSRGLLADGGTIATEVHARIIVLRGFGEVIVSVIQDVTERLAAQETIRHLAFHDTLTGLANRVLLDERMRMAMASADRHGDVVGVVFMDLDAFKPINDTYGHAAGDLVLKTVAERIGRSVRENDTVARMGGDEFLVLFPRLKSHDQLSELGRKVHDCIEAPIDLEGGRIVISAKVGLAVYREGEAPDELISRADHAMYDARTHGTSGWQAFGPSD